MNGPWLTPHEGQAYVGSASIKAFWQWRKKHGIIARSNGHIAKRDLDRALRMKKPTRRGLHANSRANLVKRHHSSEQAGKQGLSV